MKSDPHDSTWTEDGFADLKREFGDFFAGRTCLVTGADGFMGSHLTDALVALVTPFRNDAVDEAKLRELVDFHVKNGTDAIIPCGTTGESPTLSHDEHRRVVGRVLALALLTDDLGVGHPGGQRR